MVKYTNLGATQTEAEFLNEVMIKRDLPYTLTEEGASIHLSPDTKWDNRCILSVIARRDPYTLFLDTGFGHLYLINNLTGTYNHSRSVCVIHETAVVLDAEFYGLEEFFIYLR